MKGGGLAAAWIHSPHPPQRNRRELYHSFNWLQPASRRGRL